MPSDRKTLLLRGPLPDRVFIRHFLGRGSLRPDLREGGASSDAFRYVLAFPCTFASVQVAALARA